jgi:hypothetical protein
MKRGKLARIRKSKRQFRHVNPDASKCPASHRQSAVRVPELVGVPVAVLEAERRLLLGALQRTLDAGDTHAEAAARRCIAVVEDAILSREEC